MSNELAIFRQDAVALPSEAEWKTIGQMAAQLVPTGFLPKAIDTPQKAVAIILKGRELAAPAMYALSNIAIINGKPVVSAEMMLALIYRDHGKQAIRVKSSTDTECVVEYRLAGWEGVSEYAFTIAQAKTAGLMKNPVWTSYPAAMLRARCISAVARMAFPESIAGMYVPGELGEPVDVDESGEVRSAVTGTIIEHEDNRVMVSDVYEDGHHTVEHNSDTGTFEIVEDEDEKRTVKEAKAKVWDLVANSYKWGKGNADECKRILNEVSQRFMVDDNGNELGVSDLSVAQLNELHQKLVTMDADKRRAIGDGTPVRDVLV